MQRAAPVHGHGRLRSGIRLPHSGPGGRLAASPQETDLGRGNLGITFPLLIPLCV